MACKAARCEITSAVRAGQLFRAKETGGDRGLGLSAENRFPYQECIQGSASNPVESSTPRYDPLQKWGMLGNFEKELDLQYPRNTDSKLLFGMYST